MVGSPGHDFSPESELSLSGTFDGLSESGRHNSGPPGAGIVSSPWSDR